MKVTSARHKNEHDMNWLAWEFISDWSFSLRLCYKIRLIVAKRGSIASGGKYFHGFGKM